MAPTNPIDTERRRDPIPRYLWRAYSLSSAGVNNEYVFESARRKWHSDEQVRHLDEMSRDEAADALTDKLGWTTASKRDSELISFSSSLLWVLQHAIRKTHCDHGQTPGTSSVQICLLDTSKFPDETFDSAISFLRHHHVRVVKKRRVLHHVWFEGEYFAHGSVQITAAAGCVVSLSSLIKNGLLEMFPEFGDKASAKRLAKRVLDLRNQWFYPNLKRSMTNTNLSANMELAGCFAEKFQHAALIFFLAIHSRSDKDRRLISKTRKKPDSNLAFEMDLPKAYHNICEQRIKFRNSTDVDMNASRYNPFWKDGRCDKSKDLGSPESQPDVQQCCDIMDMMCLGEDAESFEVGGDGDEGGLYGPFAALSMSNSAAT